MVVITSALQYSLVVVGGICDFNRLWYSQFVLSPFSA